MRNRFLLNCLENAAIKQNRRCTSEYMSNCAGPLPFLASLPRVNLDHAGDPTPELEAPIMTRGRLILDIFGQTLGTLWPHKLPPFLPIFPIACFVPPPPSPP